LQIVARRRSAQLKCAVRVSNPGPADCELVDSCIIWAVFVPEGIARIWSAGPGFWRDRWLMFDTLIVAAAVLPLDAGLSALRILRLGGRLTHLCRQLSALRIAHVAATWLTGRRPAVVT
jgi:hypothetical protein